MKRFGMMTALACLAFSGVVAKAAPSDVDKQVLGPWKLQMTTPDGVDRDPTVIVGRQFEKYVAWYVDDDEPQRFKEVRIEDDTLVGTIRPQERPEIRVTLRARLSGENACEGTGEYRAESGDSGSWSFTGKRVPLSSFDEVMTWKLSFVSPDGERHDPTVTVVTKNSKHYAWYSGSDHELPASSIRVDGDRVEMKIAAETAEGTKVDVTFRGTVDGDRVEGNAEYDLEGDTGSFPFTGKRSS